MKAKTHERDPRVDPRPGDVLRTTVGEAYRVVRADHKSVDDTPIDPKHLDFGETLTNSTGEWRGFMLNAEVIHVAD